MITDFKQKILIDAVKNRDSELLKQYHDEGYDFNFQFKDHTDNYYNLLYLCIMDDNDDGDNDSVYFEILKQLISYGVDINFLSSGSDGEDYIPLSVSLYWEKYEIFKYLLSVGADINNRESDYKPNILFIFIKNFLENNLDYKYFEILKKYKNDFNNINITNIF